ncbi:MAG: TlpA disulfide reductase family protein [Bacteroidota bacterium]
MMKILFCLVLPSSLSTGYAQKIVEGLWRGQVEYSNVSVPFSFAISYENKENPVLTILNGEERRELRNVKFADDSLTVLLEPFDVSIKAKYTNTTLSGFYIKHHKGVSYPFSAEYSQPRFSSSHPPLGKAFDGKCKMLFGPDTGNETAALGLFEQRGNAITGTIMSTVSDYRFFQGIQDGDSVKMSSFDGAHAFLLLAKQTDTGWQGRLVFDDNYAEDWVASYDPSFELADPFEEIKGKDAGKKPYFDLLAAGEGRNVLRQSDFKGKVTIVQLFGTWCPNSDDQTTYLVDWYQKNQHRDIALIASSFEANYSKEYGLKRIKEYVDVNNIPYRVVLGGMLSKTSAAMPFPFMNKIQAFPTLVILDKEGMPRYVVNYFNGPATGAYYEEFDHTFNQVIDRLLGE